ncbi:MAG TPA: ABC transporter ATP-binding protein [Acidimicrobiales bacterium]|nr:ABC transporter ATP-binding protein [Acidimicrobiales bacterium]
MSAELVIETADLRRSYGPVAAVAGVDLQMRRGEVLALLGPNGAGKTTTVEILEGYRRRDSGTVRVLGQDPERAGRSWRARRGVVLQDNGDLDDLTVAECMHHFAAFYPRPANPGDLTERIGLGGCSAALVRTLSGGQRRRLDVALGLVGRPELLFLDEPTTGFDPEARRGFWSLVRDLAAQGTSIMLTTHYLDEAEALADRVAVINRGRIVACGPPADIGDRRQGEAEVSWQGPDGRQRVRTAAPTALVSRLRAQFGGEVPALEVRRPSLEDAYLRLIGPADGAGGGAGAGR